jgi:hypothetical protein
MEVMRRSIYQTTIAKEKLITHAFDVHKKFGTVK